MPPKRTSKSSKDEKTVKKPRKSSTKKVEVDIPPSSENLNPEITKILKVIGDYYSRQKDFMRSRSYKAAIDSLSTYGKVVESGKEAKKLPGIGPGIAKKIDEYIDTGSVELYKEIMRDPATMAITEMSRVYGIGPTKAAELANSGVTKLEQLFHAPYYDSLSTGQQIGLKYVRQLEQPVPKEEANEVASIVKKHAKKLSMEAVLVGGFRRGRDKDEKISFIVRHSDYTATDPEKVSQHAKLKSCQGPQLLKELVEELRTSGLIIDDLTTLEDGKGATVYKGIVLPPSQANKQPNANKHASTKSEHKISSEMAKETQKSSKTNNVSLETTTNNTVTSNASVESVTAAAPVVPAATGFVLPSLEDVEDEQEDTIKSVPTSISMKKHQKKTEETTNRGGPSISMMSESELEAKKKAAIQAQKEAEKVHETPLEGPIQRMISIQIIPHNFWYPALLAHTASDAFLQSLHASATKKKWHLNTYALRQIEGQWTQNDIDSGIEEGRFKKRGAPKLGAPKYADPVELNSEDDIFTTLEMDVPPMEARG